MTLMVRCLSRRCIWLRPCPKLYSATESKGASIRLSTMERRSSLGSPDHYLAFPRWNLWTKKCLPNLSGEIAKLEVGTADSFTRSKLLRTLVTGRLKAVQISCKFFCCLLQHLRIFLKRNAIVRCLLKNLISLTPATSPNLERHRFSISAGLIERVSLGVQRDPSGTQVKAFSTKSASGPTHLLTAHQAH